MIYNDPKFDKIVETLPEDLHFTFECLINHLRNATYTRKEKIKLYKAVKRYLQQED